MHIILGGTGQVGSAVAAQLLRAGEAVTVVTRSADKAASLVAAGAEVAELDVLDSEALHALFRNGRRAFLLNPPAAPDTNTDLEEHRTLRAIVDATQGSGLEALVLASTYGARMGEGVGDLSVLYDFEQALLRRDIPVRIQRGAYYMSNWAGSLEAARQGTLPSLFDADFELPMAAPEDLGAAAARAMLAPPGQGEITHVEGPRRYTPRDVAAAFAASLGRPVQVAVTPRAHWRDSFLQAGFSHTAASAYTAMIEATVDNPAWPEPTERGPTTLEAYIDRLVRGDAA